MGLRPLRAKRRIPLRPLPCSALHAERGNDGAEPRGPGDRIEAIAAGPNGPRPRSSRLAWASDPSRPRGEASHAWSRSGAGIVEKTVGGISSHSMRRLAVSPFNDADDLRWPASARNPPGRPSTVLPSLFRQSLQRRGTRAAITAVRRGALLRPDASTQRSARGPCFGSPRTAPSRGVRAKSEGGPCRAVNRLAPAPDGGAGAAAVHGWSLRREPGAGAAMHGGRAPGTGPTAEPGGRVPP